MTLFRGDGRCVYLFLPSLRPMLEKPSFPPPRTTPSSVTSVDRGRYISRDLFNPRDIPTANDFTPPPPPPSSLPCLPTVYDDNDDDDNGKRSDDGVTWRRRDFFSKGRRKRRQSFAAASFKSDRFIPYKRIIALNGVSVLADNTVTNGRN